MGEKKNHCIREKDLCIRTFYYMDDQQRTFYLLLTASTLVSALFSGPADMLAGLYGTEYFSAAVLYVSLMYGATAGSLAAGFEVVHRLVYRRIILRHVLPAKPLRMSPLLMAMVGYFTIYMAVIYMGVAPVAGLLGVLEAGLLAGPVASILSGRDVFLMLRRANIPVY